MLEIILATLLHIVSIKGHIQLDSGNVFPIYTAYIEDSQWNEEYWDGYKVAWLDNTGWIDDKWGTYLVSHTYGPFYETLFYTTDDNIAIYYDNYQYAFRYMSWRYVDNISQMTEDITSQNNRLMIMLCDPKDINRRIVTYYELLNVVYVGNYLPE